MLAFANVIQVFSGCMTVIRVTHVQKVDQENFRQHLHFKAYLLVHVASLYF